MRMGGARARAGGLTDPAVVGGIAGTAGTLGVAGIVGVLGAFGAVGATGALGAVEAEAAAGDTGFTLVDSQPTNKTASAAKEIPNASCPRGFKSFIGPD